MSFITQGKTNWKFLVIVIILAIIVGGGALWYTKRPEQPYKPPEINKLNETADWKTYRWSDLEFKYPQTWTVEKIYYQIPDQQANGEPSPSIGLVIFPGAKPIGNDFIAIGGELTGPNHVSCYPPENHTKCQELSDYVYTDSNNPDILNVFDQLISTWKVVEIETTDWKTYRNEEYGFELKYPEDWVFNKRKGYIFGPGSTQLEDIEFYEASYRYSPIDLVIHSNLKNYSSSEWLEKYINYPLGYSPIKRELSIGGKQGVIVTYSQGCMGNEAFVSSEKYIFILKTCVGLAMKSIFDTMLSTFRFLE